MMKYPKALNVIQITMSNPVFLYLSNDRKTARQTHKIILLPNHSTTYSYKILVNSKRRVTTQ